MTKEQQDHAWACLPKEVRTQMREDYKIDDEEFDRGWNAALSAYFGKHNLTSAPFKVGDKVVVKGGTGIVQTITEVKNYHEIYINGLQYPESILELYTEEKSQDGLDNINIINIDHQILSEEGGPEETDAHNYDKDLYNALCDLESASAKVRKALIERSNKL